MRVGPHDKASDRQFKTLVKKKMLDGASPYERSQLSWSAASEMLNI